MKGVIGTFYKEIIQFNNNYYNQEPIINETYNTNYELTEEEKKSYENYLYEQNQRQMEEYSKMQTEYENYVKMQELENKMAQDMLIDGSEFMKIYQYSIKNCLSESHHYRGDSKLLSKGEIDCLRKYTKRSLKIAERCKEVYKENEMNNQPLRNPIQYEEQEKGLNFFGKNF
jgi:hypothetical protein